MTAEEKRRRELVLMLFALLLLTAADELKPIVAQVAEGGIDPAEFGAKFTDVLAGAHAHAAYLGRSLAGSPGHGAGSFSRADEDFGRETAEGQRQFLLPFVQAIAAGKYDDDQGVPDEAAILKRAKLYVRRLRGTANEAWVKSLPRDTVIHWDDRQDSRECEDCHGLAQGSPYSPASLPTFPGASDTQCLMNCRCRLWTEDGQEGFTEE